jgi:hypothetical protein
MALVHGLQISADAGAPPLTPEQKRFNTLIGQIERARRTLAAWRDNVPLYARAHVQVIVPLAQTLAAARRDWTFMLDQLLNQPGWNRTEQGTLRELICDSAAQLLDGADTGEEDQELKALFDKHSEVDFDTEQQQARMTVKEMAEMMTGLDLGDIDGIGSDEELMARMREGLAARAAGEEAARTSGNDDGSGSRKSRRPRRKTAAQQRREAEAQLATQSVREVFRKLASALHPDRETDPVEREAKTALMQQVNQAYAANDLLALLELQLQIEQVDAGHIAGASAQRIRHYNKVLAEQLAELKAEAEGMELRFRMDFGLQPGWGLDPLKLLGLVDQNARQLRDELAMHQREVRTLADKAATRRWLKREQKRLRDDELYDEFF